MSAKRSTKKSATPKAPRQRTRVRRGEGARDAGELRRAREEAAEAREQQAATAEILRVISSSPSDVQPVFEAIVKSALPLFDGMGVAITIIEGDSMRIRAQAGIGRRRMVSRTDELAPFDRNSVGGTAVLDRAVVNIGDIEFEGAPAFARSRAEKLGYRAIAAAPMLSPSGAIGAIVVFRKAPIALSDAEVGLLRTLADQAVIAIENVRLFNETKEALGRQTATAEILKVISSSPTDVQPVFDAIAANAMRLCGGDQGAVLTCDSAMMHIGSLKAMTPEEAEALRLAFPRPLRRGGSVSARAILTRAVVHVPEVLEDPEYESSDLLKAGNWRSMVAVPMLREGSPIGAITVTHRQPQPFTDAQIALLQTFADQAVIAIENVRLFNETKEALEQQQVSAEVLRVISSSVADTKPVFEKILQSCMRLFGGLYVGISVLGEDGQLHLAAFHGPGGEEFEKLFPMPADRNSGAGLAILDRRMLHFPDIETGEDVPLNVRRGSKAIGSKAVIFAPMLLEDRGIGAIFVSRLVVGPFSDKQLELLRTFADQAVIALENARLFNETKEALERQTATAEILKVISASPTDVQPVFDAVAERAAHICDAYDSAVMVKKGDRLRIGSIVQSTPGILGFLGSEESIALDRDTVMGRAILDRDMVQVADLQNPPEGEFELGRKLAHRMGHRTTLAVPLLRESEALGAIVLRRDEVRPFTEKQIALLRTFADQAAIAIENVRLFKELGARTGELTQSVKRLTALGEVGQAISSTLDLEKVLQTVVSRAIALSELDGGALYEYDEYEQVFRLRAAENMDASLVELFRSAPIRLGEGAVGRTGMTREPVLVPDVLEGGYQSRAREFLIRSGSRAVLAVPLLREGHILGALTVTRNTPGPFAPEVVELLETFATQSALAIQNARLFREIAEKGRQLEAASRHKSDFLASMSHELRTPLNAILGFNEMILDQVYGELPADVRAPLENMQASGKHLLRLINNVLDLAKIEAGRMELALSDYSVHDVVGSVRSTLQPLAAEKGLQFLATLPDDLPLAYGDGGRITQCLMNLAGNSLKFTKEGKVEISVALNDNTLSYRVSDTGIGIPPDKIDNLFTEFKQTDATIASEYGGTGLGLSISKKFVEMHGGRIWVESDLGRGSAFIFEIPLRVSVGAQA